MYHVRVVFVFIRLIRQIASLGYSILAQFFTTLKVWGRNLWTDRTVRLPCLGLRPYNNCRYLCWAVLGIGSSA